jgi:hypothetical protein
LSGSNDLRQNHFWQSAGSSPPCKVGAAKQTNLFPYETRLGELFRPRLLFPNFSSIFGYKQEFSHLQKADLRLKLTIFQRFSKFSTTFSQASSIAPFRL